MKVTWSMLTLVMAIIVAIVVIAGLYSPFFVSGEEPSAMEKIAEESFKFSAGCSENKDCMGEGVCKNGECICFIDAQCKNRCDMSIGVCI